MPAILLLLVVGISGILLSACSREVREQNVSELDLSKGFTLWEKDATEYLRLDISDPESTNLGYFAVEQGGKLIMALDFVELLANTGDTLLLETQPRTALYTKWQKRHIPANADYMVGIVIDNEQKVYNLYLTDMPPGYDEMADTYTGFPIENIEEGAIATFGEGGIQSNDPFEQHQNIALFTLIQAIGKYLFWIYAVIFGILALCRRDFAVFFCHLLLTGVLYLTFHWGFAIGCAFVLPYYICMPLVYVPPVKNVVLNTLVIVGTLAALCYLLYQAWQYDELILWIGELFGWGFSAAFCCAMFAVGLRGRCPHCGHFALSWKGLTERYNNAEQHFMRFADDGTDIDDMTDGGLYSSDKGVARCGHCFMFNNE